MFTLDEWTHVCFSGQRTLAAKIEFLREVNVEIRCAICDESLALVEYSKLTCCPVCKNAVCDYCADEYGGFCSEDCQGRAQRENAADALYDQTKEDGHAVGVGRAYRVGTPV